MPELAGVGPRCTAPTPPAHTLERPDLTLTFVGPGDADRVTRALKPGEVRAASVWVAATDHAAAVLGALTTLRAHIPGGAEVRRGHIRSLRPVMQPGGGTKGASRQRLSGSTRRLADTGRGPIETLHARR
ncbi:hypothetical protein [Deinococcus sp.]|uniref:hypothetical protein n=1 Tax=Deinococcus sp. TaxID=47478 RepID=UPI0025C064E8|nr:hypothetical protein [Deinococcus sp.]